MDFKIVDNTAEVLKMKREAVERALEAVGIQAEGYAKLELETKPRRVDTGLLRNSITHAVSGKPASVSSYKADKPKKEGGEVETGEYSGTAPNDPDVKKSVYIGTNVNYAVCVHNGTWKMKANRFLKNAIVKNKDTFKAIFETYLKQAPKRGNIGESFSGRTREFDSRNEGSTPSSPATGHTPGSLHFPAGSLVVSPRRGFFCL